MSKSEKKKGLSLIDLVAISTGQVVGVGVVTIIGLAITATGMSAWLAFGVSVLLGLISILPFIFLSSTVVLRGGEYTIVLNMLGEKAAGVYAVAFTVQCLSLSLMGASMGSYIVSVFPQVNAQLASILAITFFYGLNLLGIRAVVGIQRVLTSVLILALAMFVFFGLPKVTGAAFAVGSPEFFQEGFGGFMNAVSLYAYSTYGQYMVINFSKDAKNPTRDVPLAILITTGFIFLLYVSVAIVACGVLPLETVAGQPLTLAAKEVLQGVLFPIFIICGPFMALATTLNAIYGARANPLLRAAEDGWFPAAMARCNKKKVPYVIMTIIYLIGLIPLLSNLSIKTITNNLVLVGYLIRLVAAAAIIRLPVLFKEQWKKSFLHVPDPLFYAIMTLAILAQVYLVYLSLRQLPPLISALNIGFIVLCGIYALWRHRRGKVHIQSKITLE